MGIELPANIPLCVLDHHAHSSDSWNVGDSSRYFGMSARYVVSKEKTDVLNNSDDIGFPMQIKLFNLVKKSEFLNDSKK